MHAKTWIIGIVALLVSTVAANAAVINFNGLSHGEVLSTQFQASHGVTFSAINNHSSHPDKLVVFDTMLENTRDPDLEYPWDGGNLNVDNDPNDATSGDVKLNKLFVIAENDVDGDGNGLIDNPDDEARGGKIIVQWDRDIIDVRFAHVDMDENPRYSRVRLYDDGNLVLSKSFHELFGSVPGVAFGNRYANQLPYLSTVATFGKFDKMKISLCGSGGIDNLDYEVPEPTTMALLGLGGVGALLRRRK